MGFPIFQRAGFKKYFLNVSWLLTEKIVRAVVTMTIGIYVIRYLGPSNYGLLSYATSFVTLFSFFPKLGLDHIVVKHLASESFRRDVFLGSAFVLKFLGAIAAIFIIYVINLFIPNEKITPFLTIIIASSFIFQSFNVIDLYFRAHTRSKYVVFAQLIQLGISSTIKILFVVFKASLVWFAFLCVFDSLIVAFGLIVFYKNERLFLTRWQFDFKISKSLLKASSPLIFSYLMVSIYMRIDQILIKWILDNQSVGYYAVAVNLCEAWNVIPVTIYHSVFPALIKSKMLNEKSYYADLQKLYDLMMILSLAVVLFTILFGKKIIYLFFGQDFMPAVPVIIIYAWSCIFSFLGIASDGWFIAENFQKNIFYRTVLGMIINIVLNIIFIKRFGIVGAAFATTISYCFAVYISLIFMPSCRKNLIALTRSLNLVSLFKRNLNVKNFFIKPT